MNDFIALVKQKCTALPPFLMNGFLALGLWVFLMSQFIFTRGFGRPHPRRVPQPNSLAHSLPLDAWMQAPNTLTIIAIALITIACFTLLFRNKAPWTVLFVTIFFAGLYTLLPVSPVFIVVTPLIAIYTVTSTSSKNTRWVVILIAAAMIFCLFALTYATQRWAIELVGFTAILAAAALFGSVRRSDLAYIHEAEQRAIQAEMTREQEAQKRVEVERVAIAREVHDIVAHSISIIAIQSAAADTLIDTKPEAAHEAVGNIRKTSKQALSELRGMINVLRNDATDLTPLAPIASLPALDEVVERVRVAGIEVSVDNEVTSAIPAPISVSAYRIIQEALTNIMRHSNATSVSISIAERNHYLKLDVRDNGTFSPAKVNLSGHGIQGMRERTEALGGSLTTSVDTAVDSTETITGFSIVALIPLRELEKERL